MNYTKSTIFLLALGFAGITHAASIVVPNELETVEGNINNVIPFSTFVDFTSIRYQQVFNASDFADLTGSENITHIAFRPDGEYPGSFSSTLPNVQISLSTTSAAADTLSTTFADNIGPDETIVFSGSLSLSSNAVGPPGGPMDFDIVIALQTPFLFDPSQGNLLLDVKNYELVGTGAFDAEGIPGGADGNAISRAYSIIADGVDEPSGNSDTAGLVAKFTTEPPAIEIYVDIKFCSNPNAFNCRTKGVLPLIIFGTETFDVASIDPSSLRLCLADLSECTDEPRSAEFNDRGDPTSDLGAAECALIETTDGVYEERGNPDGFTDLDVVFEASEVVLMLGEFCSAGRNEESPPLVVSGETYDGRPIISVPIPSPAVDQLVKK